MTEDSKTPNHKDRDRKTDSSISRRAIAKKAYVTPVVLAVISIATRLPLAASARVTAAVDLARA